LERWNTFYVEVTLAGQTQKTNKAKASRSPSWNDKIDFGIGEDRALNLCLYSGKGRLVGKMASPLEIPQSPTRRHDISLICGTKPLALVDESKNSVGTITFSLKCSFERLITYTKPNGQEIYVGVY